MLGRLASIVAKNLLLGKQKILAEYSHFRIFQGLAYIVVACEVSNATQINMEGRCALLADGRVIYTLFPYYMLPLIYN